MDSDDTAIVKPWVLLNFLQDAEAIDIRVGEVEYLHLGELILEELEHFARVGEKNGENSPSDRAHSRRIISLSLSSLEMTGIFRMRILREGLEYLLVFRPISGSD